ncbi:MAG: CAP domain-containing protein [Acidimicrobiales bacterium]
MVLAGVAVVALAGCWGSNQDQELNLVNRARSANQRAAVRGDDAAMGKAQAWTRHMARTGVLEHTGGGGRIDTSGLTGWCSAAENVSQGTNLQTVTDAFLRSPAHRANLLGNYDRAGMGVVRVGNVVWVTQIFLRSC